MYVRLFYENEFPDNPEKRLNTLLVVRPGIGT